MRWVLALVAAIVLGLALAAWLVFGAAPRWNAPDPDRYPVRGIDVSHHQGAIDWSSVVGAGIRFAFIKATEGADHRDTRFAENWRAAGASGLARGAYHFFTFCTPGREQAANFLAAAPPGPGLLPPVVDVEFTGNCKAWTSVDDIRTELAVFLEHVEAAWGVPAILYLTRDARARIVDGHFDTRPKWLRNVYWRPSARGENPWLFWQFTDEGRIDGIDSPVDMNVYRGTSSEFAELLSL